MLLYSASLAKVTNDLHNRAAFRELSLSYAKIGPLTFARVDVLNSYLFYRAAESCCYQFNIMLYLRQ